MTDPGAGWPPPVPAWPPPPARTVPSRRSLALAATGAAVLLGTGAAYFVLRDRGTSGTGSFDGTIDAERPVAVHDVGIAAGSLVTVELTPGDQLDVVVAFAAGSADARRIDDLYEAVGGAEVDDPADAFRESGAVVAEVLGHNARVLFRTDVGFGGEAERLLLAVPFDVDVRIVIAPFDPADDAAGDFRLAVDSFDLDAGADADGDDLLRTATANRDIPRPFRDLARELLEDAEEE